jgi:lysophospholipase L1-like esterase
VLQQTPQPGNSNIRGEETSLCLFKVTTGTVEGHEVNNAVVQRFDQMSSLVQHDCRRMLSALSCIVIMVTVFASRMYHANTSSAHESMRDVALPSNDAANNRLIPHAPTTAPSIDSSAHFPRVFCFGDSLTFGLTADRGEPRPYAPHLSSRLSALGLSSRVESVGHSGWTTRDMLQRPGGLADSLAALGYSPDALVLLAGTNDLGSELMQPEVIFRGIKDLHELAWAAGVRRSVAVGIPPVATDRLKWAPSFDSRRIAVNRMLEQWASEPSVRDRLRYIACPAGIPELSRDGVHFKPAGYERLGVGLADAMGMFLARGAS